MLTSCDQAGNTTKITTPIFGWFHGNCFATQENNLQPKTEIFVVKLDSPQSISRALIIGAADVKTCGPLAKDRRQQNESAGLNFYNVLSDKVFDLAIGIIGNIYHSSIKNDAVIADITNSGKFVRFSHCATSDGLSFDIWPSMPYKEKPVWSGYYYLGYDVERSCP